MINIDYLAALYEAGRNERANRARKEEEAAKVAAKFVATANEILEEMGITSHKLQASRGTVSVMTPRFGSIAGVSIASDVDGYWTLRGTGLAPYQSSYIDEVGSRFMEAVVKDAATLNQW